MYSLSWEFVIQTLNQAEEKNSSEGFVELPESDKPYIIVPDIHGRLDFVQKALDTYTDSHNIVFLGDILHREDRKYWESVTNILMDRGKKAFKEAIMEELYFSISSLVTILNARLENDNIYLVRGNHDDVAEKIFGPYGKYSSLMESSLFGDGLKVHNSYAFKAICDYERTIPYVLKGPDFLCSHAISNWVFEIDEIECNHLHSHEAFAWSDNTYHYNPHTYEANFKNLGQDDVKYWFIGHRPVKEPDMFRTHSLPSGMVYQNNHPKRHVVIEKKLFEEPTGIEL